MLIPTMSGKESAGTARVKVTKITAQEEVRLEARRARGHTHLMVGMRTGEGRFLAAILSLRLAKHQMTYGTKTRFAPCL